MNSVIKFTKFNFNYEEFNFDYINFTLKEINSMDFTTFQVSWLIVLGLQTINLNCLKKMERVNFVNYTYLTYFSNYYFIN